MVKKIGMMVCSAALVLALLCGCWGKDDSSSQTASPSPTATPNTSSLAGSEFGGGMDNSDTGAAAGESGINEPGDMLPDASALPDNGASLSGATMKPTLGSSWELTLVNAENPLSGDFSVSVRGIEAYPDRQFDERAADALENLLADAEKAGNKLYLVSAYRSVKRQSALYERKVNWYLARGYEPTLARTQAAKWVAEPGASEHNLGLAADIVSATWYQSHDDLTEEFEDTPEFAWLSTHAAQYGFVLRYPKNKTAATGIGYEPWHYRYVGKNAAKYLTENGLCLEELQE